MRVCRERRIPSVSVGTLFSLQEQSCLLCLQEMGHLCFCLEFPDLSQGGRMEVVTNVLMDLFIIASG
ncbi:hypothetical protein AAC387_Pa12g1268 [Persea americana]